MSQAASFVLHLEHASPSCIALGRSPPHLSASLRHLQSGYALHGGHAVAQRFLCWICRLRMVPGGDALKHCTSPCPIEDGVSCLPGLEVIPGPPHREGVSAWAMAPRKTSRKVRRRKKVFPVNQMHGSILLARRRGFVTAIKCWGACFRIDAHRRCFSSQRYRNRRRYRRHHHDPISFESPLMRGQGASPPRGQLPLLLRDHPCVSQSRLRRSRCHGCRFRGRSCPPRCHRRQLMAHVCRYVGHQCRNFRHSGGRQGHLRPRTEIAWRLAR
jgi:hypothetical protein